MQNLINMYNNKLTNFARGYFPFCSAGNHCIKNYNLPPIFHRNYQDNTLGTTSPKKLVKFYTTETIFLTHYFTWVFVSSIN